MAKKRKKKQIKKQPVIQPNKNQVGTNKTPEVLKSEMIRREAIDVYRDTQRIARYYPPGKMEPKIKHENGEVIIYSSKQIREIEMENLSEELIKKIEERQKQIKAGLKVDDTLAKLSLGVLFSTGLKMSIDDIILEIGTIKNDLPVRHSVYSSIRKIIDGPFGKFILVSGKKVKSYKIRYPQVSLIDFEMAFDFAINLRTKHTIDTVIKSVPELEVIFARKVEKAEETPSDTKGKEAESEEEKGDEKIATLEEQAINDFFEALKVATIAARKIPGFEFEGEFSSKSQK